MASDPYDRTMVFGDPDALAAASGRARILGQPARKDPNSIQNPKLNGYDLPKSVYMIYMHFDEDGQFVVQQLYEKKFKDTVADAEKRLLKAATSESGTDVKYNFADIVWTTPYYVTFVIDNKNWRIHWGLQGKDDPIRFLERKAGSTQLYVTDNYTFYAAERVEDLGRGDAFRCINYHIQEDGQPVKKGAPRDYCFQIYLEAPFALSPSNSGTHIVLIVDPDGQNQGPRT